MGQPHDKHFYFIKVAKKVEELWCQKNQQGKQEESSSKEQNVNEITKKTISDEELSHGHGQFIKTWTVNTSKERTFNRTTRTDVPAKRPSPHANPG